jgi:hypothetical protein
MATDLVQYVVNQKMQSLLELLASIQKLTVGARLAKMSLNFVNGITSMIIKGIISEDFINYKKPCMVIEFPVCKNFKCGQALCQNNPLIKYPDIEISYSQIVKKDMENDITQAIVFMGLEPFDSPHDLFLLIEGHYIYYTSWWDIPPYIWLLMKLKLYHKISNLF